MSNKTTIYDIAKELNITAATVSRALNNNPKISSATRTLVMSTAAKMNYKQNKLALALKSGKSNNVGVIVPRINTNFFASVIRGIEEELQPNGYQVIICQTHEDEERQIENINTLLNAQVDGILMSISNVSKKNDSFIERIVQKNVPLIFFDRKKNMEGVSSVTINDFKGAYLATQHLIDQGNKRIAFLSGDRSLEIYEDRYNGYVAALADNSIELIEDYIITIKSNVVVGREVVEQLLKLDHPPTAIFSTSDFAALGAIQKLKEFGVKIPEEFCVFGFGNEPFTKFMELSISTVDQSPLEMGRMAAKVFLEQINNSDNLKIEKKVVLMPELHIRKSSLKFPK
ncbi:LacI family DNA-binding transcriptional regulator [Flavobacterium sp. F-380]|uniref:LacI family DNA-binding transcriptional regulator n=1 Tax=Flavobacterium kayseriense TaxID=2764714 RepID=A0ABR7J993_9FLAO|nr:LacI family DNA-binding transcriptional regulator [Flavobacterium kayseriense]MBC5842099.1 LacI family DNA-binding transcriptional regulator [Flavobacterium kayseriense]MBC5848629.1 LacI family DNA-binding transcriptional regulator [Flavobacterium kayseriense]MBU0941304.1 LacI family transcriptional regulator [Bacteroidota bacterium]